MNEALLEGPAALAERQVILYDYRILQSSALLLKSDRGGCNGCILYDSIPRGIMQGPADHSPHKNYSMKRK